jgi:hypothetical protein
MFTTRFSSLLALAGIFLAGCGSQAQSEKSPSGNEVQVEMKNVMYHFTDRVSAHIIQLRGRLVPTKPGQIAVFDDKNSFVLSIASGQISITADSLARVLNDNVFNESSSPIKNISIHTVGDSLSVKGNLHQKGDIPFEATGTLAPTGDGRIRVHTDKLKAAHLPVKGLLDLLGLKLANLINTKDVPGLAVDGNDLMLDPRLILPPPHIAGIVTGVHIEGNEIVQIFGAIDPKYKFKPGNYMAYRGNQPRFGKLTMNETDLILLDMDPKTPFDFYLDHYLEQLVAGYTKITNEFGLRVSMRDFDQLHGGHASEKAAARPNHAR